jgi:hypothetical protein
MSTGPTGPWGQQGLQGPKGPRGVTGATGYGYGLTTGPTGGFGWPTIVNPAADPTYLTRSNIGTINVITSNVDVNTSGLTSGDAGGFWTFSNIGPTGSHGVSAVSGSIINVGGTNTYQFLTVRWNSFSLVWDGSNLLPV